MVVLHPGSEKKVSFLPKKVRESQGISFLTTRMNPGLLSLEYMILAAAKYHLCLDS